MAVIKRGRDRAGFSQRDGEPRNKTGFPTKNHTAITDLAFGGGLFPEMAVSILLACSTTLGALSEEWGEAEAASVANRRPRISVGRVGIGWR